MYYWLRLRRKARNYILPDLVLCLNFVHPFSLKLHLKIRVSYEEKKPQVIQRAMFKVEYIKIS